MITHDHDASLLKYINNNSVSSLEEVELDDNSSADFFDNNPASES
jgi:hypothetical protein